MKTAIVTFLIVQSLSSAALAKSYTCREAIDNRDGRSYSGVIKPNGITVKIRTTPDVCRREGIVAHVRMQNGNLLRKFTAKVEKAPRDTQGYLGGVKGKDFDLSFGVLPPYKETNENKTYLGGDLYLCDTDSDTACDDAGETDGHLMFCKQDLDDVFDSQSCD